MFMTGVLNHILWILKTFYALIGLLARKIGLGLQTSNKCVFSYHLQAGHPHAITVVVFYRERGNPATALLDHGLYCTDALNCESNIANTPTHRRTRTHNTELYSRADLTTFESPIVPF